MADEMYLFAEYDSPNAHVKIYRPILTEEERARRMKRIHDAACRLVIAEERRKARLGIREEGDNHDKGRDAGGIPG